MDMRTTPTVGRTSFTLHFTGYLYAVGLRDAFADLIVRHEQLRTVYPMSGSSAAPRVLSAGSSIVPRLAPVPVTAMALPDTITEFLDEENAAALSLPVRARLFRQLGELEDIPQHLLVVTLRRAAADRVSPALLARDLMTAYAARRRNLAPAWDVVRAPRPLRVHELRGVRLIE
ncbi:hypothetical protein AB0L57_09380 [Nocardia sp. NPDC052254]|uniref:hypothetical protein n=1 Tax=Nocardia sp. NPDC052254 TaxID=3155681 RepID=UPI00342481D1